MTNPVPTGGRSRAERKRARKADDATGYAGDSAGALTYGVIALLVAGVIFRGGAQADVSGLAVLVGFGLGVSGLIALGQGIHALASNLDRTLRLRLDRDR